MFKKFKDYSEETVTSYIVKNASQLWRPAWDANQRTETIFRATGPIASNNKEFIPYRYSNEDNDFTDWILRIPLFIGGTTKPVSFIAIARDATTGTLIDSSITGSPASTFIRQLRALTKDNKLLYATYFIPGPESRYAPVPKKLLTSSLVQGIMLKHPKLQGTSPLWNCILLLSKSATNALCDKLNQRRATALEQPSADPFSAVFEYGDIIHSVSGRAFSLYNSKFQGNEVQSGTFSLDNLQDNSTRNKVQEFLQYACDISHVIPIPKESDGTLKYRDKLFTPWEQCLILLTETEMIDLLCSTYSAIIPKELFQQIFAQYQSVWPDTLRHGATIVNATPIKNTIVTLQEPSTNLPTNSFNLNTNTQPKLDTSVPSLNNLVTPTINLPNVVPTNQPVIKEQVNNIQQPSQPTLTPPSQTDVKQAPPVSTAQAEVAALLNKIRKAK